LDVHRGNCVRQECMTSGITPDPGLFRILVSGGAEIPGE
jgi:hypothetical protein